MLFGNKRDEVTEAGLQKVAESYVVPAAKEIAEVLLKYGWESHKVTVLLQDAERKSEEIRRTLVLAKTPEAREKLDSAVFKTQAMEFGRILGSFLGMVQFMATYPDQWDQRNADVVKEAATEFSQHFVKQGLASNDWQAELKGKIKGFMDQIIERNARSLIEKARGLDDIAAQFL